MLKDLLEVSRERIRNPFISSFIIAAVILNWKLILFIALSSLTIRERISFAEGNYINWLDYLLFPLIIAFFYTLVLPYLMVGIDYLLKDANMKKIKAYYHQEKERTREKAKLVEEEVKLEIIRGGSKDIIRLNETIEELKQANEKKDNMLNSLQSNYNELKLENQELQLNQLENGDGTTRAEVIQTLLDHKFFSVFKEIADKAANGVFVTNFKTFNEKKKEFQRLIDLKLIEIMSRSHNHIQIKLTLAGKYYWKQFLEEKENI